MRSSFAKEIVDKRIVGFHLNPFRDGRSGITHDPTIVPEDGSWLRFVVEKTDTGEYGIAIVRHLSKKIRNETCVTTPTWTPQSRMLSRSPVGPCLSHENDHTKIPEDEQHVVLHALVESSHPSVIRQKP